MMRAMNRERAGALPLIQLKIERRSNHPWIFQKMVEKPEPHAQPGSVVDIVDRDGHWVGRGFYNGHSRIALRVLTAGSGRGRRRGVLRAQDRRRGVSCAATC